MQGKDTPSESSSRLGALAHHVGRVDLDTNAHRVHGNNGVGGFVVSSTFLFDCHDERKSLTLSALRTGSDKLFNKL